MMTHSRLEQNKVGQNVFRSSLLRFSKYDRGGNTMKFSTFKNHKDNAWRGLIGLVKGGMDISMIREMVDIAIKEGQSQPPDLLEKKV